MFLGLVEHSTHIITMDALFGRRKTPEQMLRENQRMLNRAIRDLDRERSRMEQQEKKVIADIKKMAKAGQMVCYLYMRIKVRFCVKNI